MAQCSRTGRRTPSTSCRRRTTRRAASPPRSRRTPAAAPPSSSTSPGRGTSPVRPGRTAAWARRWPSRSPTRRRRRRRPRAARRRTARRPAAAPSSPQAGGGPRRRRRRHSCALNMNSIVSELLAAFPSFEIFALRCSYLCNVQWIPFCYDLVFCMHIFLNEFSSYA